MITVSIIVTSHDSARAADIRDLLSSVRGQTQSNYELIYVVEGSPTLAALIGMIAQEVGIPVRIYRNLGYPGLSEARNLGAKEAIGGILAFVDDDVMLTPGWTGVVEETFKRFSDVVGVTGPAYPFWTEERIDWLPRQLDWLIGCTRWFSSEQVVEVRNCWGMNMAFRQSAFKHAGGFSTQSGYHRGSMAEDVELSLRIKKLGGLRIAYVPEVKVFHKVHAYRMTSKFIVGRSIWIGRSRRGIFGASESTGGSYEVGVMRSSLRNYIEIFSSPGSPSISKYARRIYVVLLSATSLALGFILGPRSPATTRS